MSAEELQRGCPGESASPGKRFPSEESHRDCPGESAFRRESPLLLPERVRFEDVPELILREASARGGRRFLAAIDGRCASGKTTFAEKLSRQMHWPVFHMDDFFLPPEMRTPERLAEPGGNVDRERFFREVLGPLREGRERVSFRAFDCKIGELRPPVAVAAGQVVLIEGAYSCHPALREAYDLRIFLTVSEEEQRRRILARNGEEGLKVFLARWIPMEEKYFEAFGVAEQCELLLET